MPDNVTDRFGVHRPRFLVPYTNRYKMYGNAYIGGVYLHNVQSVDGIEVLAENLEAIEFKMRKLLTTSQTQKTVRFVPVAGAEEMRIGFEIKGNQYIKLNNWFGCLGNNLWEFGKMLGNESGDFGYTKVEWCSRAVDFSSFNDSDKTYLDQVGGFDADNSTYENVPTNEVSYLSQRDTDPYTENELNDKIVGSSVYDVGIVGGGSSITGQYNCGKNGGIMVSYAPFQSWEDGTLPWEFQSATGFTDVDMDGIPDDYEDNHNALYLKIMVNDTTPTYTTGDTLTLNQSTGETDGYCDISMLLFGSSWIAPYNVDMGMNFSLEYDGNNTQKTSSGHHVSNQTWSQPPGFKSDLPWTGYANEYSIERVGGRRSWSFKLSQLHPSHLHGWPSLDTVHDWNTSWQKSRELQNFIMRVVAWTEGTMHPFIFQPSVNRTANLAICRFENDSFSFTQTGPQLYEIPLRVVESW